MDSNTTSHQGPDVFSTSPSYSSYYNEMKENDIIIDLGLSLGTSFQPESFHPSGNFASHENYSEFMGWPYVKASNVSRQSTKHQRCEEDTEGVESKERWAYVKVNMEGVVVGRKVCILDHAGYASLARQLENMFGGHCLTGLRLFEGESEFTLFYKDANDHWRTAGDVPWKEFVDSVKRLKITRKDEALFSSASSQFPN
ncbi:hypothetical protein Scep_023082 [Stephania cephalantha]|uniref:Auxin-responsive protein n=1 Tax=Stephania cephalantha TaxID=152367 RepID=A0AAP0FI41_9MAGN